MEPEASFLDAIARALREPAHAISYAMGRELARLLPDQAIVATRDGAFEPLDYAGDGHCRLTPHAGVHSDIHLTWLVRERRFCWSAGHAWLSVEWQGHALEAVRVAVPAHYGETEHWWVIGPTTEIVEGFVSTVCDWCSEVRSEVLVFDGGCWHKSAELYAAIRSITLESLVLSGDLRNQISDDFAQFFASRELYERYGVPWKRGVLFVGPPGNGKTHAVKALVNCLGLPCLYVRSLKAPYGGSHAPIASVFERARRTTPCILVLEDLDSLVTDANRAYFLNELDGFAANTGVLVLATTNHPERLDPAILERPSRFDRKYAFVLPGEPERAAYLALWNEQLQPELRVTPDGARSIVAETNGFSFAYLKELVVASMMAWMRAPAQSPMDTVMLSQVEPLLRQMQSGAAAQETVVRTDEEADEETGAED